MFQKEFNCLRKRNVKKEAFGISFLSWYAVCGWAGLVSHPPPICLDYTKRSPPSVRGCFAHNVV